MSEQQKALAVTYKGGPSTPLIRHLIPTPGPGDVLVKLEGVGLNPLEWMLQKGFLDFSELIGTKIGPPRSLGCGRCGDCSVPEAPSQSSKKAIASYSKASLRLLHERWLDIKGSTHQQYTLIDATLTAKIPDGVSFLEAASITLCLATAALGLAHKFSTIISERGGAGLKPFCPTFNSNQRTLVIEIGIDC
ncbi:hypothetical protein C8R44DRAFT_735261 [Mycena epipterygia]|nr:hypothetical protein C8R44DRAFT_735261 [Mycena epipterygia]